MAKVMIGTTASTWSRSKYKKTSQGNGSVKFSSMNKSKKRSHKKYRGQGKSVSYTHLTLPTILLV